MLLGDLNGTLDDRALSGITSQLHSAQDAAGDGFGFTWPAKFPVARIDQILVRGMEPTGSWGCPPPAATICRWRPESACEHRPTRDKAPSLPGVPGTYRRRIENRIRVGNTAPP
ncbi:hypothetical protein STENM327S_05544 [Streptomyces tendae]